MVRTIQVTVNVVAHSERLLPEVVLSSLLVRRHQSLTMDKKYIDYEL